MSHGRFGAWLCVSRFMFSLPVFSTILNKTKKLINNISSHSRYNDLYTILGMKTKKIKINKLDIIKRKSRLYLVSTGGASALFIIHNC